MHVPRLAVARAVALRLDELVRLAGAQRLDTGALHLTQSRQEVVRHLVGAAEDLAGIEEILTIAVRRGDDAHPFALHVQDP